MDDYIIEQLLACPVCKGGLKVNSDTLTCQGCNSFFHKTDGIYIMLGQDINDYDFEQKDVFDRVSDKYDEYLHAQPFYTSIRDKYVLPNWFKDSFSSKNVLDIGSGTGWASGSIMSQASILVNLDISFKNLQNARKRLGDKKVLYIQADMKRMPFRANKFDIVTCFWALHHIQTPDLVISEIKRVLVDKGIFLGIEPNIRYTWVEFWSDFFHMPHFVKRRILSLHKKMQKYSHKRLEVEEYYMRGIELRHDHHAGLMGNQKYADAFRNSIFNFEFIPIGLEFVPPRFFMSKNKFLVDSLLNASDWCFKHFNKRDKGIFFMMKAAKKPGL